MFGISADFLTGRYIATAHNDRNRPEWPPHPARLFSALIDGWAEVLDQDEDVGLALDWLASLPAPIIDASEASGRKTNDTTFYVPVNDASVLRTQESLYADYVEKLAEFEEAESEKGRKRAKKKVQKVRDRAANYLTGSVRGDAGLQLLPSNRVKKPRTFVSVTPEEPIVRFLWPDIEVSDQVKESLGRALKTVSRLGHSSSFVHLQLLTTPGAESLQNGSDADQARRSHWVPDPSGQNFIRWVDAEQRNYLVEDHQVHYGLEPRVLPARPTRYRKVGEDDHVAPPETDWAGDWFVFQKVGGDTMPIYRAADVARAMHGALVSFADEGDVHPAVSGRDPQGNPTSEAHVSIVPLPFVGREHADGHILGLALVLPDAIATRGRDQIMRAIGRWEQSCGTDPLRLTMGRAGVMEIERAAGEAPLYGLRNSTWCRPSKIWRTVTPVALDRNPGDLSAANPEVAAAADTEACRLVAEACARIGLPAPVGISVHPEPAVLGSVHSRRFSPFPRARGRIRRVLIHARLEFERPVRGPVLLGAGRYRGIGLFRPTNS